MLPFGDAGMKQARFCTLQRQVELKTRLGGWPIFGSFAIRVTPNKIALPGAECLK